MKLKKIALITLSTMLAASCLAGCGNSKHQVVLIHLKPLR